MAERFVVWFSCGAASAVAAKLAVEKYGNKCVVVYCDTLSTEHPDNARFGQDVEKWLGREIEVIRSSKYKDIDEVFEKNRYMAGVKGAKCTTEMKKLPREAWQREDDVHIFGYTVEERRRADLFEANNPALVVEWLLIEQGVTKDDCLRIIKEAGIELPAMYALGFEHNNCLGCVKSASSGYWNRIRRLFPDVFARRARQSRLLGVRLVKVGLAGASLDGAQPVTKKGRVVGYRIYLDTLPQDENAPDDEIECGPVCQTPEVA